MGGRAGEVNSTTLSPRRPQDFNNIRADWASSLLDHRHRLTFNWIYQVPWFQGDKNWVKRNILGNYQVAGVYTVESPEYVTPQSAADANLNADAAGNRGRINTTRTPGPATGIPPRKNYTVCTC